MQDLGFNEMSDKAHLIPEILLIILIRNMENFKEKKADTFKDKQCDPLLDVFTFNVEFPESNLVSKLGKDTFSL